MRERSANGMPRQSAAFRAADLGMKVTLVDPGANPGGVCLYLLAHGPETRIPLAGLERELAWLRENRAAQEEELTWRREHEARLNELEQQLEKAEGVLEERRHRRAQHRSKCARGERPPRPRVPRAPVGVAQDHLHRVQGHAQLVGGHLGLGGHDPLAHLDLPGEEGHPAVGATEEHQSLVDRRRRIDAATGRVLPQDFAIVHPQGVHRMSVRTGNEQATAEAVTDPEGFLDRYIKKNFKETE